MVYLSTKFHQYEYKIQFCARSQSLKIPFNFNDFYHKNNLNRVTNDYIIVDCYYYKLVEMDNELKKKYFLNTAASLAYKAVAEMKSLTIKLNGKEESAYGLAGLGDLYVSSAGGRNSKMGYYLGQGHLFKEAKDKFMKDITIEGADLALEIGPKVLKEFNEKEFPLLFSVIKCICSNQKLEIHW